MFLDLFFLFLICVFCRPNGTRFFAPATLGLSVSIGDVVTFTYSASKNEAGEEERERERDEKKRREKERKKEDEDQKERRGKERESEGWMPLDPVIVKVRKDMFWEEMIAEYGTKPRERNANGML